MSQKLTGTDVDCTFSNGIEVIFDEISVDIEDGMAAPTNGRKPDGYVDGESSAKCTLSVNHTTMSRINDNAKSAGGWKKMEPVDINWEADTGDEKISVNLTQVKLLPPKMSFKKKGGEAQMYSIEGLVTDDVEVDGVSWLE